MPSLCVGLQRRERNLPKTVRSVRNANGANLIQIGQQTRCGARHFAVARQLNVERYRERKFGVDVDGRNVAFLDGEHIKMAQHLQMKLIIERMARKPWIA